MIRSLDNVIAVLSHATEASRVLDFDIAVATNLIGAQQSDDNLKLNFFSDTNRNAALTVRNHGRGFFVEGDHCRPSRVAWTLPYC